MRGLPLRRRADVAALLRGDVPGVGRRRVCIVILKMGIDACAPQPGTSRRHRPYPVFPYLLRHGRVTRPNEGWRWTSATSRWRTASCTSRCLTLRSYSLQAAVAWWVKLVVGMVRPRLATEGGPYECFEGGTRDRQKHAKRFPTDPEVRR